MIGQLYGPVLDRHLAGAHRSGEDGARPRLLADDVARDRAALDRLLVHTAVRG